MTLPKLLSLPFVTLAFVMFIPLAGFWAAGYALYLGARKLICRR